MSRCARKSCQHQITGVGFRIENDGSVAGQEYCHDCGSKIIGYDASRPSDEVKLKYKTFEVPK